MPLSRLLTVNLTGILLFIGMPVFASPYTMKGPPRSAQIQPVAPAQQVSIGKSLLLGTIHLYRRFISPTQGGRCGFYPSCSTFGMHAVQHYGPLQGVMMTADRLTRCNIFKQAGPDYYQRHDGRLYDPVEANLLREQ